MLRDILAFLSTPRLANQNFDTPSRRLEKSASIQNSGMPSREKNGFLFYVIDVVRIKKIKKFTCTHHQNIMNWSSRWSIWTPWYFLLSILRRMLRDILAFPSTPGMADQNFDTPWQPLEKPASIQNSDLPSWGEKDLLFICWAFFLPPGWRIKILIRHHDR